MSSRMNRRTALLTGGMMAAAGALGARTASAWAPGPDEKLKRDLKPGPTPIRLGGYFGYGKEVSPKRSEGESPGVCRAVTSPEPWNTMNDSQLRELRAAPRSTTW